MPSEYEHDVNADKGGEPNPLLLVLHISSSKPFNVYKQCKIRYVHIIQIIPL